MRQVYPSFINRITMIEQLDFLTLYKIRDFFFFFDLCRVSGQFMRTIIIFHGLLDILQAQKYVKHHEDDRRVHKKSN